jgi:uncharacterized protein
VKIELDLTEQSNNRIDSYEKGLITIKGESYTSSLIVTPSQLITNWAPKSCSDIALQHLSQITSLKPEIILIGTGQHSIFPSQELLLPIVEMNIGLEIMDTGAACRCYNLLMNEGRKIAAGLILIEN